MVENRIVFMFPLCTFNYEVSVTLFLFFATETQCKSSPVKSAAVSNSSSFTEGRIRRNKAPIQVNTREWFGRQKARTNTLDRQTKYQQQLVYGLR